MKIYLVGGAVRDQLLGREIKERDWVVVGSTAAEMLAKGFKPVGKDFPVFLDPKKQEEYALARTERKTGKGYTGFECFAEPSVTLEEDLLRRDLTINAIAQTPDGEIIDPYHGQQDLKDKVLRHVSEAFVEDPVRILRVARFAARFEDFSVAPDTMQLMQTMVQNGEVDALVPERVWKECSRALSESAPVRFFEMLRECGALEKVMPEAAECADCMTHLTRATQYTKLATVRFAAMCLSLELAQVKSLGKRLKAPNAFQDLALLVARNKTDYIKLDTQAAEALVSLLEKLDAFRRPEQVKPFGLACEAENEEYDNDKLAELAKAYNIAKSVDTKALLEQGLQGREFGLKLHELRVSAVATQIK